MRVRCIAFGLVVLIALAELSQADTVLHVDLDATDDPHDGSSWCHAFLTLHEALAVAQPGTTLKLADGTYWPDDCGLADPREATFQLSNGVTIEGGYAGCGAAEPDERDIVAYETTLSGDTGFAGDPNDNCYHVVTGSGTDGAAVLDGLTITEGNADGLAETLQYFGGGMLNDAGDPTLVDCRFASNRAQGGAGMANFNQSQPTLTNCTFANNTADYGGGMANDASNPELTGCWFVENQAAWRGGGMANHYTSNVSLTGCVFVANVAFGTHSSDAGGGAMFNWSSSPTLANCTFEDNLAAGYGGAMSNRKAWEWEGRYDPSNPVLVDCTFNNNTASSGGGMINGESSPTLIRCTFSGNVATNEIHVFGGGAIFNEFLASPILEECTFEGNSAALCGGAVCSLMSTFTMTDCVFAANTAGIGGGLANYDQCAVTLTRCAFIENSTLGGGGGIYNRCSEALLTDCPFARNFVVGGPHRNSDGAGVYSTSSSLALVNCSFRGNEISGSWQGNGGAVISRDTAATLVNCTFVGNTTGTTSSYGGGLAIRGTATVTNCTFAANVSGYGGGIDVNSDDPVTLANCILYGNEASTGAQLHDYEGTASITNSCIQAGYVGQGNIDAEPQFIRAPDDGGDGWGDDPNTPDVDEGVNDDFGDLHLLAGSPCIDSGDNTAVPPDLADLDGDGNTGERLPLDLDGNPRFVEDAYSENTGVADPPYYWQIVDMGAYELQFCFGDLDGDGVVGTSDIMQLLCAYGAASGMTYEDGDLDFDGDVDLADLATLLSVYGTVCS